MITIERLTPPGSAEDRRTLAHLLVQAVESGAAVSFVLPLTVERAEEWWQKTLASAHARAIFLVARDVGRIVGTVQLHPAWAPNQPHRGDVVKLIVDERYRGSGMGARLMQAVEDEARRTGFTLLTLDAKSGTAADRLYRRLGWIALGTIPRYAVDTDGVTPHDATVFYKTLSGSEVPRFRGS
jgi:GNAT superfamily N-acetyltransferase